MSVICKLFGATIAVGVVGTAISAQPLAAAPIAALASLHKASAVDVQTVQWRDWNGRTQYGSDYDYYGPRYRSDRSGNWNPGERLNTETQYGSDYGHYSRRSTPSRAWNPGERSNAGTQYGPDYGYYGPR
jgi:Ni/Co efflux regulator RcnB